MSGQARTRFTFLDGIRLVAGLILLNSCLSWWFTSSKTWGYDGKWIDPRYLKYRTVGVPISLSERELSQFDGSDQKGPIYIAINGSLFDVTSSRDIYGPGGTYHFFTGRDGARAFVTGCFWKEDEFTHDLRGLDPKEAEEDVRSWQRYFTNHKRYWRVGNVLHDPITGDPPAPCKHQKYPG